MSLDDLSVLRPNQSTPHAFEDCFSTLLVRQCISNNAAAVKELVCSPLSTALINGWTSEVHTFIEGLDPLSLLKGFRPLHWATLFNCIATVEVLLDHGADMIQKTWTGLTAIHLAIVIGHFEILERMFAV
jgi:ankyrin repeat protein